MVKHNSKMKGTSITFLLLIYAFTVDRGIAQNPEEEGSFLEGDIVGSIPMPNARSGLTNLRYRWPNRIVPYAFNDTYPQDLRDLFQQAADHISYRTCIRFVPRTNQKDFVQVMAGRSCYSYVGRIGGRQTISLPRACKNIGSFVHEIMHALGFLHEQSRLDRDDYVNINWENIRAGVERNFVTALGTSSMGVPYDYASVLHYSAYAFTKNRRMKTIEPRGNPRIEIGQRRGMSPGDIDKINKMYQC